MGGNSIVSEPLRNSLLLTNFKSVPLTTTEPPKSPGTRFRSLPLTVCVTAFPSILTLPPLINPPELVTFPVTGKFPLTLTPEIVFFKFIWIPVPVVAVEIFELPATVKISPRCTFNVPPVSPDTGNSWKVASNKLWISSSTYFLLDASLSAVGAAIERFVIFLPLRSTLVPGCKIMLVPALDAIVWLPVPVNVINPATTVPVVVIFADDVISELVEIGLVTVISVSAVFFVSVLT